MSEMRFRWFDALFLSILTVFSYFSAYIYEMGFANYYGFSRYMIGLSVTMIINTYIGMFFYIIIMILYFQLLLQYVPSKGNWTYGVLFSFVLMLFLILLIRIMAIPHLISLIFIMPSIAVAIFQYIIRKRLLAKAKAADVGKREELKSSKIVNIFDFHSNLPEGSIASTILSKFGFDPFLFGVMFVVVFPAFFYAAGYVEAKTKRDYYVFVENNGEYYSEYIALFVQDGKIVAALYDRNSESYEKSFIVRDLTDKRIRAIRPVKISKLSNTS